MLRPRQRLGKYRIERKLAEGGFGTVYQALDTIEGIRVALKIPHRHLFNKQALEDFRNEARVCALLDHPNILPLKNAGFIDGKFVIAFSLGDQTLGDRLRKRTSFRRSLEYTEQLLEAVAHAHQHRVMHCDVTPENLILFPGNRLRLADFGIAKVALRTLRASGSGTVGYIAPEQAMGRPSLRSDVFSAGLVIYRMLAGNLPEWPYDWPPPGFDRLRRRLHPDFLEFLRRAIAVKPKERFEDGQQMLGAFRKLKSRVLSFMTRQQNRRANGAAVRKDWRTVRFQQFQREFGKLLQTKEECAACHGPISEFMRGCPWCGVDRNVYPGPTNFPLSCPRCHRGMKLDWSYCPWCFGPGFEMNCNRHYTDRRYLHRCGNAQCKQPLMPFMSYCPWCKRKVRKRWTIPGSDDRCSNCNWGVLAAFWDYCPWCVKPIEKH